MNTPWNCPSLKMEKPWHPSATRLASGRLINFRRYFEHRSITFLNRHEAVRLKFTLVENWTQGITQFSQNGRMLNQFRISTAIPFCLSSSARKERGDSIFWILSSKWQANGKTGSSWFWFKDRTPGGDSPQSSAQFPIPDLNLDHWFSGKERLINARLNLRWDSTTRAKGDKIVNSLWVKEFGNFMYKKGRSKFVNKTYLLIMLLLFYQTHLKSQFNLATSYLILINAAID